MQALDLVKGSIRDSVTTASAIAAVLVLLNSTVFTANMITFTFKITFMTTGAEWRVAW